MHYYAKGAVGESPGPEGSFQGMEVCLRHGSNVPGKLQLPNLKRVVSVMVVNMARAAVWRSPE